MGPSGGAGHRGSSGHGHPSEALRGGLCCAHFTERCGARPRTLAHCRPPVPQLGPALLRPGQRRRLCPCRQSASTGQVLPDPASSGAWKGEGSEAAPSTQWLPSLGWPQSLLRRARGLCHHPFHSWEKQGSPSAHTAEASRDFLPEVNGLPGSVTRREERPAPRPPLLGSFQALSTSGHHVPVSRWSW